MPPLPSRSWRRLISLVAVALVAGAVAVAVRPRGRDAADPTDDGRVTVVSAPAPGARPGAAAPPTASPPGATVPLTESAEAQARHAAERIEAADQASSRIRMIERAEADRASGATACGATTAC